MKQIFELASGTKVVTIINEKDDCITIGQYIETAKGIQGEKRCTVTCHNGKSYSWTCSSDKDCLGDCTDANNPKGSCV